MSFLELLIDVPAILLMAPLDMHLQSFGEELQFMPQALD